MQIIEINEPGTSNHLDHDSSVTVGIDFGTTNSLIALSNNKQVEIISNAQGSELTQSIVGWNEEGEYFIGNAAIDLKYKIHSIKRLLGKSSEEISSNPMLYNRVKNFIDLTAKIPKLRVGKDNLSLPEVAAEIFKYLKYHAEISLKQEVKRAVVTVPAYFDNAAKGAVMLAAKIAGLEVIRLIAEPTAAAYAYGLNKNTSGAYLVYDLGGGTFDVSILNMQSGILQVIATGGDNMLGGDDIDHLVADYFKKTYEIADISLIDLAKQAKEALTKDKEFALNKDDSRELIFDRKTFEQIIYPLLNRTINIACDTLEQAGNLELNGIILVGGCSRIPLISKLLKEKLNTKIFKDVDPDKVVVCGAALQAENLTSNNLNSLLIDVVPLSLGLELYGGLLEKIILRNSPIPLSVTKEFTSYADNQTAMQFHIYQGEREMVDDCRSLGQFELKDIPPMKAGSAIIEVTFSIDADGILSVSAQEKITGKSQIIEIKPTFGLNDTEINEILETAFKNAANDHENRLLQETILDAKSLIYNIENVIKEMPDAVETDELERIKSHIVNLKKLLKDKDRSSIAENTKKLENQTQNFVAAKLNRTIAQLLEGKIVDKL
jgi:molecular chaperone HscA